MSGPTPLAGNDTDEHDKLPPSPSLPPEKLETPARGKKTRKKPGNLAKRWGVQPNHFDYKNKIPKFVINGELTAWALSWIDKDQDRVHMLPQSLRQSYTESAKRSRVKHFVDLEPGVNPQIPQDPKRESDDEVADYGLPGYRYPGPRYAKLQMSDDSDEELKVAESSKAQVPRLLYPANDIKRDEDAPQSELGLRPTTGWGQVPDVEVDELPHLGHRQGGSAPLPPPSPPTAAGEDNSGPLKWPLMEEKHPISWIKQCRLDQEGLEKSAERVQETTGPDNEATQRSHPAVPSPTSEASGADERFPGEDLQHSA